MLNRSLGKSDDEIKHCGKTSFQSSPFSLMNRFLCKQTEVESPLHMCHDGNCSSFTVLFGGSGKSQTSFVKLKDQFFYSSGRDEAIPNFFLSSFQMKFDGSTRHDFAHSEKF